MKATDSVDRATVLNLLAVTGRPMPVGEITAALPIGQSTVSHHLKILAETRFVLVETAGTANLYRVNERCLTCFPSAADAVMGRAAPNLDDTSTCGAEQ